MVIFVLLIIMIVLNASCIALMFYRFAQQKYTRETLGTHCKLGASGVLGFMADTLGVGSFAVNMACARVLKTFRAEDFPAVNNGAQILPGMLEAIFFIKFFYVDLHMLVVLVTGACIGGITGGLIASKAQYRHVRTVMLLGFLLLIAILVGYKLHWYPCGGENMVLSGHQLILCFFAMIFCGFLASFGVGLFVLVQATLFLLNVSPLVAFPIMSCAGALQQPLTTMIFLQHNKIPLQKTIILSLWGCLGVLFAALLFAHLTVTWLHSLLLLILIYNAWSLSPRLLVRKTYETPNLCELP